MLITIWGMLIRAMSERKRFFSEEVFPKSSCQSYKMKNKHVKLLYDPRTQPFKIKLSFCGGGRECNHIRNPPSPFMVLLTSQHNFNLQIDQILTPPAWKTCFSTSKYLLLDPYKSTTSPPKKVFIRTLPKGAGDPCPNSLWQLFSE